MPAAPKRSSGLTTISPRPRRRHAAKTIIAGIEKNAPRILIGGDARFMDLLQRFRPGNYFRRAAAADRSGKRSRRRRNRGTFGEARSHSCSAVIPRPMLGPDRSLLVFGDIADTSRLAGLVRFGRPSMPWNEVSVMDQRHEFVRLALQEGANRRELCRRFGISPDVGYKWLGRWQAGERSWPISSRRPHASPRRIGSEAAVEAQVLAIRDQHPAWGARKIAHCLKRDGQMVACAVDGASDPVPERPDQAAPRMRRPIPATASRRKLPICCGRWTSRATCRSATERDAIR